MKNVKQLLGIGLMTFALTASYGCEPKTKKTSSGPIIAHAYTTDPGDKTIHTIACV